MLFLPGRLTQHLEITIIEYHIRENNYGRRVIIDCKKGKRLTWRSRWKRERKEKGKLEENGCCLVEMMLVIGLDSQLNLLIINQYMRNTLNTYDRNPDYKASQHNILGRKAISARTSIALAIILLCLQVVDCRETVLVESLRSKNDKIMLKMLEQTHDYIEFERYIDSRRF